MCYIIFPTTNSVFMAEDIIKNKGIDYEIHPTPATDRVCCGLCIVLKSQDVDCVLDILDVNSMVFLDVIEQNT